MIDPSAIDEVVRHYEAQAEELGALGRRVWRRVDGSSWTCARADRCRGDSAALDQQSNALAEELRSMAAALRQVAAQRREQMARDAGLGLGGP